LVRFNLSHRIKLNTSFIVIARGNPPWIFPPIENEEKSHMVPNGDQKVEVNVEELTENNKVVDKTKARDQVGVDGVEARDQVRADEVEVGDNVGVDGVEVRDEAGVDGIEVGHQVGADRVEVRGQVRAVMAKRKRDVSISSTEGIEGDDNVPPQKKHKVGRQHKFP
jgi:hypothetical protein